MAKTVRTKNPVTKLIREAQNARYQDRKMNEGSVFTRERLHHAPHLTKTFFRKMIADGRRKLNMHNDEPKHFTQSEALAAL